MYIYIYTLDEVTGEIKETVVKVRETIYTYKAISGFIPEICLSYIRKENVPYLNGDNYVSTERDPEAARKAFRDRAEWQYIFHVGEAKRNEAEMSMIETCPIRVSDMP